jgi:hypothetical protein
VINYKNIIFLVPVHGIAMFFITIMLIASPTIINIAAAATWYVSNDEDSFDTNGGTSWGDAFKTIQRGIDEAVNDDTVLVADGTYTGLENKNLELQGKAITVQSLNGPENCIIDCENSGRGFYIHEGEGPGTIISGFTIQNGNVGNDYGGAIYILESSAPTINNCIIRNNSGDLGSGISCLYSGVTVINCQFINNTSDWGGGIYALLPWSETDNVVVVNSIISGNYASIRGGGILFVQPMAGAYFNVINSTIAGNTAANGGGLSVEICGGGSGEIIVSSILHGNTPDAIWVDRCSPVITYSVGSGYEGVGNTEESPLFISISDPDPENWNLRVQSDSPCIDAGNNLVMDIATQDLDAKPRFIDGDDDTTATVDMGAYEFGDICECDSDTPMDLDTDGLDLANYIFNPGSYEVSTLAEDFGRADCPNYQYQYTP